MESDINIDTEEGDAPLVEVEDVKEDLITPEDDVADVAPTGNGNRRSSRPASAGVRDFLDFNGFTEAFSRRNSTRSSRHGSITSLDSGGPGSKCKSEFMLEECPCSDEKLVEYVKELTENFKRSHQLKDILNESWFKTNPNSACNDTGNTLLHIATKLSQLKLVTVIGHYFSSLLDINTENNDGNTALHLCASSFETVGITETLLKHGAKMTQNKLGLSPLQLATLSCNLHCVEIMLTKHYPEAEIDSLVLTNKNETLLHLACKGTLNRVLDNKDKSSEKLQEEYYEEHCQDIEKESREIEIAILMKAYPCIDFILEHFKKNPDLMELEDDLPTSPGQILHYFTCLNHVEGVKRLLKEPFLISPNNLNKNQLSALLIASLYNMTRLAHVLLENGGDPNVRDPKVGYSPLHFAILGYHADRVDETCDFIDALLEHGANPKAMNNSGETAPHLCVNTLEFRIMSRFIEHLGAEEMQNIRDESGNTLFHYAVGCLDEDSIFHMMSTGVDLMSTNHSEVAIDQRDYGFATEQLVTGFQMLNFKRSTSYEKAMIMRQPSALSYKRTKSITVKRIPMQEAMKTGNGTAYFNALRRLDLKVAMSKMNSEIAFKFLCMHLTAATREARSDLVRILFHQVSKDKKGLLHNILLFKDVQNEDETFTKTALEWAVENNDRLCTTEILHQEYECHIGDRKQGLSCLRQQLNGDELLVWTIETFTMFYDKTWAQSYALPLLGLIPVFLSISTFVYDYYSDFELTFEYYQKWNTTFDVNSAIHINNASTIYALKKSIENGAKRDLELQEGDSLRFLCQNYNESHYLLPGYLLRQCSKLLQSNLDFVETSTFVIKEELLPNPDCSNIQRTPEEYRTAFFVNIICICFPFLVFYLMGSRVLWQKFQRFEDNFPNHFAKIMLRIIYGFLTVIFAPFFILYVAVRQLIYKFQHLRATRKNKVRKQLQETEYLWGISRTAEAALESCGQLILQIWLLSSDFNSLSEESFPELVDKTYNGVIFFLSFSIKEANDIEKSLGKMVMSLLALVCGVAASYRTLKRGSVVWSNTVFIYFSLTFQIFARIFSLGLFFFTVRDFMPTIPILLSIHFALVFVLKWTFERARHTHGMMALMVAILNIFASSLVYVRILPLDKQVDKVGSSGEKTQIKGTDTKFDKSGSMRKSDQQHHSTFFVQSLFFLLVFVENMLLASWPLIKGGSNRALACLGTEKLIDYLFMVSGLCGGSWICHILYYKYMGHPWTEINGPQIKRNGLECNLHLCGEEKYLTCKCCPYKFDFKNADEVDCDICDEDNQLFSEPLL